MSSTAGQRLVLCPPDLASEHFRRDRYCGRGRLGARCASAGSAVPSWAHGDRCAAPVRGNSHGATPMRPRGVADVRHDGPRSWSCTRSRASRVCWRNALPRRTPCGHVFTTSAVTAGCRCSCAPCISARCCCQRRTRRWGFLLARTHCGVTHISGTPSHWRRALMSGTTAALAPAYVRLSGEIADRHPGQPARRLSARAHRARVRSTEAALRSKSTTAWRLSADLLRTDGETQLRVMADTLQIRSPGNAVRYLGEEAGALRRRRLRRHWRPVELRAALSLRRRAGGSLTSVALRYIRRRSRGDQLSSVVRMSLARRGVTRSLERW